MQQKEEEEEEEGGGGSDQLPSGSVIISIAMASPRGVLQQELDLLASHTLGQLARELCCLQKELMNPSPDSHEADDCFFFVDGICYVGKGKCEAASAVLLRWLSGAASADDDDDDDELREGRGSRGGHDDDEDGNDDDNEDGDDDDDDDDDDDEEDEFQDEDDDDDDDDDDNENQESSRSAKAKAKRGRGRRTLARKKKRDDTRGTKATSAPPKKTTQLQTAARMKRFGLTPTQKLSLRPMSGVQLDGLPLKLGRPFLYCHHGHCEHVLKLADVRQLHPSVDPVERSAYPRTVFRARIRARLCDVCQLHSADFITYGDRLAPLPVNFFCRACHHSLHYSADGQLLYDFTVFPYVHDL